MTPKEVNSISIRLSARAKEILDEERNKLGLSQSAYIEKVLEGNLPNHLEAKIETLRLEIEALREEVKK